MLRPRFKLSYCPNQLSLNRAQLVPYQICICLNTKTNTETKTKTKTTMGCKLHNDKTNPALPTHSYFHFTFDFHSWSKSLKQVIAINIDLKCCMVTNFRYRRYQIRVLWSVYTANWKILHQQSYQVCVCRNTFCSKCQFWNFTNLLWNLIMLTSDQKQTAHCLQVRSLLEFGAVTWHSISDSTAPSQILQACLGHIRVKKNNANGMVALFLKLLRSKQG